MRAERFFRFLAGHRKVKVAVRVADVSAVVSLGDRGCSVVLGNGKEYDARASFEQVCDALGEVVMENLMAESDIPKPRRVPEKPRKPKEKEPGEPEKPEKAEEPGEPAKAGDAEESGKAEEAEEAGEAAESPQAEEAKEAEESKESVDSEETGEEEKE